MDAESINTAEQTPPAESIKVYHLGQRPAFILQPTVDTDSINPAIDVAKCVNELRLQGMIAIPHEDGSVVGFIHDAKDATVLKDLGGVSFGVSDRTSKLRVGQNGSISMTCDALIACARGHHLADPHADQGDNGAVWSTHIIEGEESDIQVKGTRLRLIPDDHLSQFTHMKETELPELITEPMNENLQTAHLKKAYMVKVDINNFSSQSENEDFLQQCLKLLGSIETELAQLQHDRIHTGQVAGDALTFFFDNMFSSRSIEKAIAQALLKNPGLKVKTTGYSLGENVILAKDENNRVFYADQVVLHDTMLTKEKAAKETHQKLEGASLIDIAEGKTELYGSAIVWDLDRSLSRQSLIRHVKHSVREQPHFTSLPRRQFEMPSTLAA